MNQVTHSVMKDSSDKMEAKIASVPPKLLNNQNQKKDEGRFVVGKPYQIKGKWYHPKDDLSYKRVGKASWYGSYFHGRLTANGEIYNMNLLTAAHPTLPLPSYARVTNLKNGASIIVRVNDRGPFKKDRIIDLSKQAAVMLGYADEGVTDVQVEYVARAPTDNYENSYLMASYVRRDSIPSVTKKKEKDAVFLAFSTDSQRRLIKTSIDKRQPIVNKEQSIKPVLIKLPEAGPILPDKPVLFNQMVFADKAIGKIMINSLNLL
ncbi:septal ring lytic transglycosylase RlpA family protein [Bartonella australis]|uniref:septal ring lytic transglycosylase RlpA family protein n=1 Tax=Bartonella australis TaxID=388640 RepID=UPI0030841494